MQYCSPAWIVMQSVVEKQTYKKVKFQIWVSFVLKLEENIRTSKKKVLFDDKNKTSTYIEYIFIANKIKNFEDTIYLNKIARRMLTRVTQISILSEFEKIWVKLWYLTKKIWNLHSQHTATSWNTFFFINIEINKLENYKCAWNI